MKGKSNKTKVYRRSKKGQIAGTVFIYILAAMLFSLILLFGYRAISDFIGKQGEVEMIEMKNTLKSSIMSVAATADVKKRVINVPPKYERVCFIEGYDPQYDVEQQGVSAQDGIDVCDITLPKQYHAVACDAWREKNVSQNVFLDPLAPMPIDVGKIKMTNHSLCIPVTQGMIVLKIEGRGDSTRLSQWKD